MEELRKWSAKRIANAVSREIAVSVKRYFDPVRALYSGVVNTGEHMDNKDLKIEFTDQVQDATEKDPKMAEALREFCAMLRQAHASVQLGQHKTLDDALTALGAEFSKHDPDTGEIIPGASLHKDLGLDDED